MASTRLARSTSDIAGCTVKRPRSSRHTASSGAWAEQNHGPSAREAIDARPGPPRPLDAMSPAFTPVAPAFTPVARPFLAAIRTHADLIAHHDRVVAMLDAEPVLRAH